VEVDPVEEDPRPIAPATALHQRLDGHYPQLLPEWLALAAERGLRPPPELVPALLDHAAVDPSLHAAVGAAAGPLGRWLAERRSHWAFVHGAGEDVEEIWAEGGSDERRALFERLRGSDPAAGRALLERTFADETWEDRAAFVETLATGLSDADEPLLELALDDRRKPVRDAAAHLLAGLPRSRFGARMAERAAPLLRVEGGRLRGKRLVVELPGDPDGAAKRDGVPVGGRRSERLHALLAATPLATWTGAEWEPPAASPLIATGSPLGAAGSPCAAADPPSGAADSPPALARAATAPASPADLVALDVADDLGEIVHRGWADAAVAQRDAEWARALWAVRHDPVLLAALPHEEAQQLAARAERPDVVAAAVPGPWGATLTIAVLNALQRHRTGLDWGQDAAYAGERLNPAFTEDAEEKLRDLPGRDIRRLLDVLSARAAMLRELT